MSITHLRGMKRRSYNEINEQIPARGNAHRNDLGKLLAREILNANALKIRMWASSSMSLQNLGTATLPVHQPPTFKMSPLSLPRFPSKISPRQDDAQVLQDPP